MRSETQEKIAPDRKRLREHHHKLDDHAAVCVTKLRQLGNKEWPATNAEILLGLLVKTSKTVKAIWVLLNDNPQRGNVAQGLLRPLLETLFILDRLRQSTDDNKFYRFYLFSRAHRQRAAKAMGHHEPMTEEEAAKFYEFFKKTPQQVNGLKDWLGDGVGMKKWSCSFVGEGESNGVYEILYNLTSASLHGRDYDFFVRITQAGFENAPILQPDGVYGQALKLY
ncbi:MAG: DUF5677 domain-containing protein [Myxococcota bacterium]